MSYSAPINNFAEFQRELIGCWKNEPFRRGSVGGDGNPRSYNIMPLPETNAPHGYILKNFRYTERLRFNDGNDLGTLAIAAVAPNRGGLISQDCRAVFYEQQVRFAEGPQGPHGKYAGDKQHGDVVHVENGAWLWLPRFVQRSGPYSPPQVTPVAVTEDLEQPVDIMIAKQMSIPHGNSILALGTFDTINAEPSKPLCTRTATTKIPGHPVIPDGPTPYPQPAVAEEVSPGHLKSNLDACKIYTTEKSTMADYQNPHPDLTRFPNRPLQQAVELIKPDHYMHWYVTTKPQANGEGHVINIPFEQRVSNVIDYSAEYWLLFRGKDKFLAYTQTIPMVLTIKSKHCPEGTKYVFPHVTCNTVKYIGKTGKDGCCAPLKR